MNLIESYESRNKELAISATSKIFEKVSDALRKRDTNKRWFWELLQNAKDTVVYKKDIISTFNQVDKKVDVKLTLRKNERGETILVFEHNGNPFLHSNHPYKYDDPKCLLLADSGKIEEEESQREDVTGQFGTGFLSTHILSLRILVEGVFIDRNENMNEFNFELDRRDLHKKLELVKKVEKSLDQYNDNFKPIVSTNELKTSFTYFLDDNQSGLGEGFEIVKSGLDAIEKHIPYVLSFSKEIQSIEITDELLTNSRIRFSRNSDLSRSDKQISVIEIMKEMESLIVTSTTPAVAQHIHIAIISDIEQHIDLATQLYGITREIHEIEQNQAVLFCTFPLIGSENWRFPLMFNCNNFYPETERNGITLIKDKDNGNRDRVEAAIELYKVFCTESIEKGYQNLLFLADTRTTNCPVWCDQDWYEGSLNNIREFLLNQPMVVIENGHSILLKDALFPNFKGAEKLSEFWDICHQYAPLHTPRKSDIEKWNSLLQVDYSEWNALTLSISRLLEEVEDFKNLTELSAQRFDGDNARTTEWLNKLYHFVLIVADKKELFDECAIIPNQNGDFMKLEKLRYDVNIPEELKDVLMLFNQDQRDMLIHKNFTVFSEHISLNVEDISTLINKFITDKSKSETANFRKAMFLLSSYFTSENSVKRNTIHEFAFLLFPTETPETRKILPNTSEFNWNNINNWMVQLMVSYVESFKSIDKMVGFSNKETATKWLNSFINFLSGDDYHELLTKQKVIPNQYDEFCSASVLYNDNEDIPETLKRVLYSLSNKLEDWNSILLNNNMELNLHREKTVKEIAGLIDDLVKNNRDNLENKIVRTAILDLVRWVADKKDSLPIEDLFKWFYLNKANLVLNSLESGNDRDNIFEIIQSGQSLDVLARIANSNLTEEQLNVLANNTDMIGRFISWLENRHQDSPNKELGNIGEEFTYFYLCKTFGAEHVEWSKECEFDFKVFHTDRTVKYYIDSKTTNHGIGNSDNVPFYMRMSQWNFLPREEVKDKYLIARVFKNGDKFDIRFLNVNFHNITV